jgi:hypothetical protein
VNNEIFDLSHFDKLAKLSIKSLECVEIVLPQTIKKLTIFGCYQLSKLNMCSSFTCLSLWDCPELSNCLIDEFNNNELNNLKIVDLSGFQSIDNLPCSVEKVVLFESKLSVPKINQIRYLGCWNDAKIENVNHLTCFTYLSVRSSKLLRFVHQIESLKELIVYAEVDEKFRIPFSLTCLILLKGGIEKCENLNEVELIHLRIDENEGKCEITFPTTLEYFHVEGEEELDIVNLNKLTKLEYIQNEKTI